MQGKKRKTFEHKIVIICQVSGGGRKTGMKTEGKILSHSNTSPETKTLSNFHNSINEPGIFAFSQSTLNLNFKSEHDGSAFLRSH